MKRLADGVELLDGPLDDPDALAGNLRDLGRINRLLGGVRLSAAAIESLAAHRAQLTLLDVGTGGADIPLALLRRAEGRGRRLDIVGIDSRPEIVAAARSAAAESSVTVDRLDIQLGDGRSIPYPDRSFDIAHASLLVHHLEPDAAVEVLAEMARVARLGIVVNDLDRTRLGWLGAWLIGHLLTGNPYTRIDAPLSVRRAYRAGEMSTSFGRVGLVPVSSMRAAFGQRYAIAAVPGWNVEPDPQRGIGVGE